MRYDLPDELNFDILSRLPSKSLLRCRSVCKAWLSLISSEKFTAAHLQKFNQLHPRKLVRRFELLKNRETYSVHLDNKSLTVDPGTLITFPFKCKDCDINSFGIRGCCNGVVCLSHECILKEDKIILWNPSIRRKLDIHPPNIHLSLIAYYFPALGFGYDKINDDYKVVKVTYNHHVVYAPQVEIYTVRTATWREVAFPQHLPSMYFKGPQVFLNGCVHWIAFEWWKTNSPYCSIMKLDLSTELFEEIPLPTCFVSEAPASLELALVNEQLAVVFSKNLHLPRASASTYIIWVMKEYKNPTSWKMMWNVKYDRDMGRVLQLTDSGEIIMGSRYGELMFRDYIMGYYDPHCLGFITEESIYVDRYEESLALLDIGEDIIKEEEEDLQQ
ncbi:F-box associated domain, type 1 [Artemisia annua]|uniref:F-box associated domain, type 1 n=1 Tax=Artemisia annua TaxID=35608 RepID=A0A2U1PTI2_ARTAN|nr:F-box associated domain, type 1 [Artemisia annua]